MTLRNAGPNARNGVNRSQAFSHEATAEGYFLPRFESANVVSASSAASSSGAV